MRTLILVLPFIGLSACEQAPLIALDDPIRAEADARIADTIFGASGIAGIAYIGSSRDDDRANLSYDRRYTTEAEIAAAPAKVCASLNGTVATSRIQGDLAGSHSDDYRDLIITCNV